MMSWSTISHPHDNYVYTLVHTNEANIAVELLPTTCVPALTLCSVYEAVNPFVSVL